MEKQWPGAVHFIDFSHPNSSQFWYKNLLELHNELDYDGIWLDMNEVSSFSQGEYNVSAEINFNSLGQYYHQDGFPGSCLNQFREFPFLPHNQCLNSRSIDINVKHFDGSSELNFHNFYCLPQTIETYNHLSNIRNTKFI